MKETKEHATPTEEIFAKYNAAKNPVTRATYRDIIAKRLGISDLHDFKMKEERDKAHRFMRGLTYSFESRNKMEKFFGG